MPEWIAHYWVQWVFGLIGSGILALAFYVRDRFKRIDAMEIGLRASLYDRLYYLHGKYMLVGWISVPDLENITGIYKGYHGLGGNGVGTKLYDDLHKLPNFPPRCSEKKEGQ